jgi:aryl-alcohol dehydrogenase-like predicted oxidoreductase
MEPERPSTESASRISRAEFLRGAAGTLCAWSIVHTGRATAMTEKMPTRPIPSTGAPLPVVGCGTWQTFDVGTGTAEREPLAEVLRVLFEAGGSVIDSSPMYGRAEAVVGDLLSAAGTRDKAFLATKVWTRGRSPGIAQMRESMTRLRTDHIDLMQIHNLVDWRVHLPTLRAWKKEGRIKYLGVTHYTASGYAELESVMRAEILDFVQVNYAMDDRDAEARILPLAADRGMAVLINRPFGGGELLRSLRNRALPVWAAEIGCESWAQILLKFVLGHPAVTCVIPGTSRPQHMADNARAGAGMMPDRAMREKMAAVL